MNWKHLRGLSVHMKRHHSAGWRWNPQIQHYFVYCLLFLINAHKVDVWMIHICLLRTGRMSMTCWVVMSETQLLSRGRPSSGFKTEISINPPTNMRRSSFSQSDRTCLRLHPSLSRPEVEHSEATFTLRCEMLKSNLFVTTVHVHPYEWPTSVIGMTSSAPNQPDLPCPRRAISFAINSNTVPWRCIPYSLDWSQASPRALISCWTSPSFRWLPLLPPFSYKCWHCTMASGINAFALKSNA